MVEYQRVPTSARRPKLNHFSIQVQQLHKQGLEYVAATWSGMRLLPSDFDTFLTPYLLNDPLRLHLK